MTLAAIAAPPLFAAFVWWFSTGMILWLNRLQRRTFAWTFAAVSVASCVALFLLIVRAGDTSVNGAYVAFTSAVLIWGWHEMSFLMGYIVGPRREACPDDAQGWRRFRLAASTLMHHEIALALTVAYFCGVTVSTWSVAHLQKLGLPPAFAVGMLSLYALANALSRAAGGVAVKRIGAKTLLIAALAGNVIGMTCLAFATTRGVAVAFALFDGFAFGMALFATTALIIDYFGLKNSPALLGAVNLAATAAMAGPTIAGWAADRTGGFAPIFLVYAAGALFAALAVAAIKPPAPRA